MRAESILRQVLHELGTKIHQARVNTLSAAVIALINGGHVGLSALGRALGPQSQKHGIKRVDRLLGNQKLFEELDRIYAAVTLYVLRSARCETRPTILVDWTESGRAMCALSAAVPVEGRAVTIYSITVPVSQFASVAVETAFLAKLQTLLGECCKPILVADAGFRGPWIKAVQAMGWDFLVRIRGRTQVQLADEQHWQHWRKLSSLAGSNPRSLGRGRLVRTRSVEARFVVVDRRSWRARSSKHKRRSLRQQRAVKAQRDPWFLATSLQWPPRDVVNLYAQRMQIELSFRDLKSRRFGWSFEDARCRSTSRVAIQIMLTTLASVISMLVGIAAENAGINRRFQANTINNRRVLSLVWLGREVIRKTPTLLKNLLVPNLADSSRFEGIR